MNKGVVIGGGIVLVIVALAAGAFLGPKIPAVASLTGSDSAMAGPRGAGGPASQLTDEQRAQMENMSDEERQAFMQEQMGGAAPGGAPGGAGGGGMSLEGEIIEVAADSVTLQTANGGSQTVYFDDTTVIGYAEGVEQTGLASGLSVIVVAQPEADNVMNATAIVVK